MSEQGFVNLYEETAIRNLSLKTLNEAQVIWLTVNSSGIRLRFHYIHRGNNNPGHMFYEEDNRTPI